MQSLSRVPRAFQPGVQTFPNVMPVRFKWAWQGTLATQAGAITSQVFRLNSLYDPDFSGAGSQPRYYDTLCGASGGTAPYQQYRVKKTWFKVMVLNPSTTSSTGCYAISQVFYQNAASSTTSLADYFTQLNTRVGVVAQAGNDNAQLWMEGSVDHAKFAGVKDYQDDDDFVAAYNSNPAQVHHLSIGVRALDDATVATYRVVVQFIYDVELVSLNDAGAS